MFRGMQAVVLVVVIVVGLLSIFFLLQVIQLSAELALLSRLISADGRAATPEQMADFDRMLPLPPVCGTRLPLPRCSLPHMSNQ